MGEYVAPGGSVVGAEDGAGLGADVAKVGVIVGANVIGAEVDAIVGARVGKPVAPKGKGVGAGVAASKRPTISHADMGCARQRLSAPPP